MGGFTSAITPLLSASSSISPAISFASTATKLVTKNNDTKAKNELEEKQLIEKNNLKREERSLKIEQDERIRIQNLDRALGEQKVSLAARGLSLNDQGTVQTILSGITELSEQERDDRRKIDALKQKSDELSLKQARERNLLDYAIQSRRNSISAVSGLLA